MKLLCEHVVSLAKTVACRVSRLGNTPRRTSLERSDLPSGRSDPYPPRNEIPATAVLLLIRDRVHRTRFCARSEGIHGCCDSEGDDARVLEIGSCRCGEGGAGTQCERN